MKGGASSGGCGRTASALARGRARRVRIRVRCVRGLQQRLRGTLPLSH